MSGNGINLGNSSSDESYDGTAFDLFNDSDTPPEVGNDSPDSGEVDVDEGTSLDSEDLLEEESGDSLEDDSLEESLEDDEEDAPTEGTSVDPRDSQIAQLIEQNKQLMAMLQKGQQPQQQEPQPEAESQTAQPLVSEEEFSKIMDEGDAKTFTSVLQRVQQQTAQTIVSNLPRILHGMIDQEVTQKQVISQFYTENSDLAEHKQHVALVGQELAKAHPEWGMPQLLKETAKEFRKRFNLAKPVRSKNPEGTPPASQKKVVRVPSKKGQPTKAGGKSGGPKVRTAEKSPAEMTPEERQLAEMESLFVGMI